MVDGTLQTVGVRPGDLYEVEVLARLAGDLAMI